MRYKIVVENEILTNAKNEDELKSIFNDKLATLIICCQEKSDLLISDC